MSTKTTLEFSDVLLRKRDKTPVNAHWVPNEAIYVGFQIFRDMNTLVVKSPSNDTRGTVFPADVDKIWYTWFAGCSTMKHKREAMKGFQPELPYQTSGLIPIPGEKQFIKMPNQILLRFLKCSARFMESTNNLDSCKTNGFIVENDWKRILQGMEATETEFRSIIGDPSWYTGADKRSPMYYPVHDVVGEYEYGEDAENAIVRALNERDSNRPLHGPVIRYSDGSKPSSKASKPLAPSAPSSTVTSGGTPPPKKSGAFDPFAP